MGDFERKKLIITLSGHQKRANGRGKILWHGHKRGNIHFFIIIVIKTFSCPFFMTFDSEMIVGFGG
jgi:hypothetical protein